MNLLPALSFLRGAVWGGAFGLAWQIIAPIANTKSLFLSFLAPALILSVIWPIIAVTLKRDPQLTNVQLVLSFIGLYIGLAVGMMLGLVAAFPVQT